MVAVEFAQGGFGLFGYICVGERVGAYKGLGRMDQEIMKLLLLGMKGFL